MYLSDNSENTIGGSNNSYHSEEKQKNDGTKREHCGSRKFVNVYFFFLIVEFVSVSICIYRKKKKEVMGYKSSTYRI